MRGLRYRPVETILDLLRAHAESRPGQLAYCFLRDDGSSHSLTFGQLDRRVHSLAARLSQYASLGDRALLMYPPGLEFIEAFLSCLAAGIIAIPAYPPRLNRKPERQEAIVEDATPNLILLSSRIAPKDRRLTPCDSRAVYLATDEIELDDLDDEERWHPPTIRRDAVAFLQYTSGSTGTPRGVMVTHGNLMANEEAIQIAFGHTQEKVLVGWLPLFHDMGLIGNVLQPLYVGFPAILFSPATFLRDPVRWLWAISEYRGTTAGAPNFAYDHCSRYITEEQKEGLDLRSWTVAYNGAEPVRAETLDRFATAFAGCGYRKEAFFPCYGLAEATLFVSGGPHGAAPSRLLVDAETSEPRDTIGGGKGRWLVGCGKPGVGTKVVVVEPETRLPLLDGKVGEVWVNSPALGGGYWGKQELSAATFGNRLSDGDGPYLNTGDLGFLRDGELFITGRSKDIIIVNGRNVYPQDVEALIELCLPSIGANSCAAFGVEVRGQERLAVVVEADREMARAARDVRDDRVPPHLFSQWWELVDRICVKILSEAEVALQSLTFVRPGTFLRTSSGKVQRGATRAALLAGSLDVVLAWDAAQPKNLLQATSFRE